ncbi:MAG: cytochrome c [Nitrospirae bacterium]|nr:cytochrome c [Nitrospirota bacterium]
MGKSTSVVVAGVVGLVFAAGVAVAAEKDIKVPRVPAAELAKAKEMKSPLKPTPDVLAKGKAIFEGKGTCFTCHGNSGKGDGPAGAALDPSPRDFTNPQFHTIRTEGEMFWVVKNGSPGTGMISYNPAMITDEEAWQAIAYERSLGGAK